jgi:YidC/Oxa1 family membrane protein insertase
MDIKRTVLLVVFSLSLLMLWENWNRYSNPPLPPTADSSAQAAAPASKDNALPQPSAPAPAAAAAPTGELPATAATAGAGESITLTTDLLKLEISTLGGDITRVELLKHEDSKETGNPVVLLQKDINHTYVAQSGLIGGDFPNHRSSFTARDGVRTLGSAETLQLVLDSEQGGVKVSKTYTVRRGEYDIGIKHEIQNRSDAPVTPSIYAQLVRDDSKLGGDSYFYTTFTGPAIYTNTEKYRKVSFEDIEKGKSPAAARTAEGWVAMVQHYFVSAFTPVSKGEHELFTRKVGPRLYAVGAIMPLGQIAPNSSASHEGKFFAGPQESVMLEKFATDFDLVKDYGWLTLIAKPIFWLMTQLHALLGNWGWTIIFLTILIKLAFFPLSAASYRSMAKMKLVTPKMTAIRERHQGDPQKMNAAMMELYKTEKINPLGGCLPILVQIPVFIALYWVLLASVEMRHAPWLGWIHDLSAPDTLFGTLPGLEMPIGLLPIIMAVSMYVQTKLNPTPPDPIQAKVMMIMPLVFSFMFFYFPSGLVLYWVVNNILSIAQQWVITKQSETAKA